MTYLEPDLLFETICMRWLNNTFTWKYFSDRWRKWNNYERWSILIENIWGYDETRTITTLHVSFSRIQICKYNIKSFHITYSLMWFELLQNLHWDLCILRPVPRIKRELPPQEYVVLTIRDLVLVRNFLVYRFSLHMIQEKKASVLKVLWW